MNQTVEPQAATQRIGDGTLLQRFHAGGDDAAFAELLNRHGPMVYGVCLRLLRHRQDAEDAFQVVFLRLARHAERLVEGDLGGWLHVTARNVSLTALRGKRRRRWVFWGTEPELAAEPSTELNVDLDAALASLPEQERSAIILCHLEGLSRTEAAQALACPEGTLSARLTRGLEKLRRRLGKAPLGILAASTAVLLPDPLPASTLGLVRHFREGTLEDWASPKLLDLYRKATPMRLLDRFGPPAISVLAAILILLGAAFGWRLVTAQPPTEAKPQQAAAPQQPAAKKRSFTAAVEGMHKQKKPEKAEPKARVHFTVTTRPGSTLPQGFPAEIPFRFYEFKITEAMNGAEIQHSFTDWSSMVPCLTQIANAGQQSIEVSIGGIGRLEANQIVNNCKRAGFGTIHYRGPQLFVGGPEDSLRSNASTRSVRFEADLGQSKEYLPDWTNGWYAMKGMIQRFGPNPLSRSPELEQVVTEVGGDRGPAFAILDALENRERKASDADAISDFARQINESQRGENQRGEARTQASILLFALNESTTRMNVSQRFAGGWTTTTTEHPTTFLPLLKRIDSTSSERVALRVGDWGSGVGTKEQRAWAVVNPLHVNLVLNACKKAGFKAVEYAGQDVVSGAKPEYAMLSMMGYPISPLFVETTITLTDVDGELPDETNGWTVVRNADRIHVVKAAERERLLKSLTVGMDDRIKSLAQLALDDFERELAKEKKELQPVLRKLVEDARAKPNSK